MMLRLLADGVLMLHLAFILWVALGGFWVLRRPPLAWLHVPAVLWGAAIEFTAGVCPLTPLENTPRRAAGEAGYAGGFIEHYLLALIYPAALTPARQWLLGGLVLAVNVPIYLWLWRGLWRRRV
ncbi:DUF2784 domain-containing protein [Thiobacter aerophilum]|uniref:DUF2784 domain-containing protein n=1 Tax=Thiobacter aerophilum TaxID=3121275 RepID=A0ABV0ECW8_9BURK